MRKFFSAALTALALGLSAGPALAAKTLYFGLSSEPNTNDPFIHSGTAFRTIKLAIHRGLVNYGIDGKLSPELAQSYEISPDAKTYTFHLRDAKFHDGSPVTAADVKATYDHILDPKGTASFRAVFAPIDHVEVVDTKTVRFILKEPSVSLVHYMALPEAVIVPAAWLAAHKDDAGTAVPIGAGPFKFVRWTRGRELVLKKFDGYYKPGKPYLDEIDYTFYPDENTRVNALKSGDVDIIDYVPSRSLADLKKGPGTKVLSTPGPFMGLTFNMHSKPLDNPDVRTAIAYTVNRDEIINTVFDGIGTPIWGLGIPEGYPGYSESKKNYYKVDIAHAKELMAKAGYPNGFEVRLVASAQYAFYQKMAVVLQQQLAQIGIKLRLDLPDWNTRMAKMAKGDYDMGIMGTVGETTDPDWLTSLYYGGKDLVRANNAAYFDDPEINRLLDQGRATVDPAARAEIYDKFVNRALELSPLLFLLFRDQSYATKDTVSGFTNMPGFLSFQSAISLENTKLK